MDTIYDGNFEEMKKYIPRLESIIKKLENSSTVSDPRKSQLDKIKTMRDLLVGKNMSMNLQKLFQDLVNLDDNVEQRDPESKDEALDKIATIKSDLKLVSKKPKSVDLKLESSGEETLPVMAKARATEEVCVPGNKEPALFQRRPNMPSTVSSPCSPTKNKESKSNYTRVLQSPETSNKRWPKKPKKRRRKSNNKSKDKTSKDLNVTLNVPKKNLNSLNTKDILSKINNCSEDRVDIDTLQELKSQMLCELKATEANSSVIIDKEKSTSETNVKASDTANPRNIEIRLVINTYKNKSISQEENCKSTDISEFERYANKKNNSDQTECETKEVTEQSSINYNIVKNEVDSEKNDNNISTLPAKGQAEISYVEKESTIQFPLKQDIVDANEETNKFSEKNYKPNLSASTQDNEEIYNSKNKKDTSPDVNKEILCETTSVLGTESNTPPLHQPKLTKVINAQKIVTNKKISTESYKANSNTSTKSKTSNDNTSNMAKDDVTRTQCLKLTEECVSEDEDCSNTSLDNIFCNLAPKSPDHENFADIGIKPPVIIPSDPVKTTVVSSEADINMQKLVPNLQINNLISNTSISPSYCKEELLKAINTEKELIKGDKPLLDPRINRKTSRVPESTNPYLNTNNKHKRYATYTNSTLNLNNFQNINANSLSISNPNAVPTRVSIISPTFPTNIPQLMPNLTPNMTPITTTKMAESMTPNARTYDMIDDQRHQWEKYDKNQPFLKHGDIPFSSVQRDIDYIDPSSNSIQRDTKRFEQYQMGSRNDGFIKDLTPRHSFVTLKCPASPNASFRRLDCPSTPALSYGRMDCLSTPDLSFTPTPNHPFGRYESFSGTPFIRPDFSQAITNQNYGKPKDPRLTRGSEKDKYYASDYDKRQIYFHDQIINRNLYQTAHSNCHSSFDHYRKFQREQSEGGNERNKNREINIRKHKELDSFNRDESNRTNSKNRGPCARNYENRHQNEFKRYDDYERRNFPRERSIVKKEVTRKSFSINRPIVGRTFHKNNVSSNRRADSFTIDTSINRTIQSTEKIFSSSFDAPTQRAASVGRTLTNDCRRDNNIKNTGITSTKKEQNSRDSRACSAGREIIKSKHDFKDIKDDLRSFKLKKNIMFSKENEKTVASHKVTEIKKTYESHNRKKNYDNSKYIQNNAQYLSKKRDPRLRRENLYESKEKHRDDNRSYSKHRKNNDKVYSNDNISIGNIMGPGYDVKNDKIPKIKHANSPERILTEPNNTVNCIDVEDTRSNKAVESTSGDDNSHDKNVLDKVGVPVLTSQSTPDSTINSREINEDVDSQKSVPDCTNASQCEMNSYITSNTTETLNMDLSKSSSSLLSSAEIELFGKMLSILQDKSKIKELLGLLGDSSNENKKIKKNLEKISEITSDDEATMSDNNSEKINDVKNNSNNIEIVVNENSKSDIDGNKINTTNIANLKEELVNLNEDSNNAKQEKDRSTSEFITAGSPKNAACNDYDDAKKRNDTEILESQEMTTGGETTKIRNYKFNTSKKQKTKTTKSVPTKEKRLTHSDVANLRYEKSARKKPTELQKLQDDIREMFLNKKCDILSTGATGKRMCRVAKLVDEPRNQNYKQTEASSNNSQSSNLEPVVVLEKLKDFKSTEKKTQLKTPKKKRKMKRNITPLESDSSLDTKDKLNKKRKQNKSSTNTKINFEEKSKIKENAKDIDQYIFDTELTNHLINPSKLENDIKSSESQSESAVSLKSFGNMQFTEANKKIKCKVVSKGLKAGIIKPKSRKKKVGGKNISKSSTCEVIKSQSVTQAPVDCFTDKTYCFVKSKSCNYCRLCTYRGKEILAHYKKEHPQPEIRLSRISSAAAINDTSDIETKKVVNEGHDIPRISNDLQIDKNNKETLSKDQVEEKKTSNNIFDYPHFKIKYTDTGSKEYFCCIKGNFHFKTHLFISLKKHVQLMHSEVWDGFCFMCKVIVTPQGVYHFKDCLQHFLDKHDNFPIFEEVISETNALNYEFGNVYNENSTALTSHIKVRPLSKTLYSSQPTVENRPASSIIESVVSLDSEIKQSSLSPSYLSRKQTIIEKQNKYSGHEKETNDQLLKTSLHIGPNTDDHILSREEAVQYNVCTVDHGINAACKYKTYASGSSVQKNLSPEESLEILFRFEKSEVTPPLLDEQINKSEIMSTPVIKSKKEESAADKASQVHPEVVYSDSVASTSGVQNSMTLINSTTETKILPMTELFLCAKCNTTLKGGSDFKKHITGCYSSISDPIPCAHCSLFVTKKEIITHYNRMHLKKCRKSQQKLNSLAQLQEHEKIKHTVMSISQPNTDTHVKQPIDPKSRKRSLGNKEIVAEPTEKIKKFEPYGNPILNDSVFRPLCEYSTKMRHNMLRHLRMHAEQQRVPQENPTAPTSPVQTSAVAPTIDVKPWQCGLCEYKSLLRPEVVNHCAKTHNSNMQFKCAYCSFRTSNSENITKHQSKSHVGKSEEIFYYYYQEGSVPNDQDGMPLWQNQSQKLSQLSETTPETIENLYKEFGEFCEPNGLKYKCPLCSDIEDTVETMQSHLYEELKYRKWGCSICSYKGFHKTGLNEHMQIEHRQNQEPVSLQADVRIEDWVQQLLEHQTARILKNKEIMAKQKEVPGMAIKPPVVTDAPATASVTMKPSMSQLEKIFGSFGTPVNMSFCCPKCKVLFKEESALKNHLESELNKIRWLCSDCFMTFQVHHEALLHCTRAHEGISLRPVKADQDPVVCSSWVKAVIRLQKLNMNYVTLLKNITPESETHQRTHEYSPPLYTDVQKPVESPGDYLAKQRLNIINKVICLECQNTFSEAEVKTHKHNNVAATFGKKGDVVTKCSFCLTLYKDVNAYNDHHQSTHKSKPKKYEFTNLKTIQKESKVMYPCGKCTQKFACGSELEAHVASSHSGRLSYTIVPKHKAQDEGTTNKRKADVDPLLSTNKIAK